MPPSRAQRVGDRVLPHLDRAPRPPGEVERTDEQVVAGRHARQRPGVVVGEPHRPGGEAVEVGRVELVAAVRAEHVPVQAVEQHDDDVAGPVTDGNVTVFGASQGADSLRRPWRPPMTSPGGAQPRPAGRRHPRRRAAADRGGGGLGQDPGAHPPDRHLIREHGVSPFEILAITFTNKAADEIKHRVGALVGPVAEKMWVSTFHAACVRILRRDADRLGYPKQFTIYDQADAVRLTGYVIRDLGLDIKRFPPRTIHAAISAAKNDGLVRRPERGAGRVYLRAEDRRDLQGVPGPPPQGRRHGLRRPPRQRGHSCSSAAPTCSTTTSAASST